MKGRRFKRRKLDIFMYLRRAFDYNVEVYLLLDVGDILIVIMNKGDIKELKKKFCNEFDMKDMEDAIKILA